MVEGCEIHGKKGDPKCAGCWKAFDRLIEDAERKGIKIHRVGP